MTLSKTVYFKDYPSQGRTRSGLTIPFPDDSSGLFSKVAQLSSLTLRQLIGHNSYLSLEAAALAAGRPIATFAREALAFSVRHTDLPDADSVQATFRGGRGSPLHDWYPYLEGYSPAFVQTIIRRYAPDARTVLDPFCGSGTTALVAASLARVGYYSEVNPVCRFIIDAKAYALGLGDAECDLTIHRLHEVAAEIFDVVDREPPSLELAAHLQEGIGGRPAFDPATLRQVLQLRTLLNRVTADDGRIGMFLTVAVLRSLIPNSLMVRRGDLRFRTPAEMANFRPNLLKDVQSSLEMIASDLADVRQVPGRVHFVCGNARELSSSLDAKIDAVITSPPYLNGTNYFRNTKIELCFLGHLSKKSDLRQFRDEAITSGINDVTITKTKAREGSQLPSLLMRTLDQLRPAAYDVRIPAMVQSYFQEMNVVAANLAEVVRPGGIVAIDLGDSSYGGIYVPTDAIVADLMRDKGFALSERIILRERQSRDGGRLSQTLQIFKQRTSTGRKSKITSTVWDNVSWQRFKNELPHQKGELAKRNWGHPWHSLCSYQGKLKPSIASTLVATFLTRPGSRFLDPFSGVGTLPFEARLHGHTTFGFDISPAAVVISRAKLGSPDAEEAARLVKRLAAWIADQANQDVDVAALDAIRFNGPLREYFNPETLREVLAARSFFRLHPPCSATEALVMACLLHILHGNRPYALSRRSHPITPFAPTGPAEYRSLMDRLNDKLARSLRHAPAIEAPEGRIFDQDATKPWPDQVSNLDAIITSPPFFDSTRFHTANWMRLWFAGWDARDFVTKPQDFVDERQKRNMDVYETIFRQAQERLREGGVMVVHLGKSRKCDMAAELSILGGRFLQLLDNFSESVEHCESHGLKDKGTVTHHQYLVFRR